MGWWLFLLIPAAILLLICLPVTLDILLFDSLDVSLKIFFIKIKLIPSKPKDNAKQTPSKKEKRDLVKDLKYRVENEGILPVMTDLQNAVCIAAEKLKTLLSHVHIHPLDLKIAVAGEDAAQTALTAGRMNAVVFPTLGVLSRAVKLKNPDVLILPRFDVQTTRVYFRAKISLSPIFLFCLIGPALKFVKIVPNSAIRIPN